MISDGDCILRGPSTLPVGLAILISVLGADALAQDSAAEIAKKLNNPIAAMISVPFQFNYDKDIGPTEEGQSTYVNIQPVIPISLNDDWNVISRTILPVKWLEDIPPGNDEDGIGDVTQSAFFSPKALTADGWTWGVGPALLLDTATDRVLGSGKWAAGPTAVALKQANGWTVGGLTNQLWSYAGNGDRPDVNATFLQPFIGYTLPTYTTFLISTESTYNWEANEWSVPVNFQVSQVFKIGNQPMQIQLGARYWADTPDDAGPEGWGWRLAYTLVFPK
jgi:hypothetical protein